MPFALVPINDQLLHACESGAVVTPNQRLARELKASFDISMRARDAQTWRTPRIASVDTFMHRAYAALQDGGGEGAERMLLSRDGLRLVALDCALETDHQRHVDLFLDAWRIATQWRLFERRGDIEVMQNGRVFIAWADALRRRCNANGWVTSAELATLLERFLPDGALQASVSGRVTLLECAGLSASERSLFEKFGAASADVDRIRATRIRTTAAVSAAHELATAAAWARQTLVNGSVGVVLPSLNDSYSTVRRQFDAAFSDVLDIDAYVNFGAGVPMDRHAVGRAALQCLSFTMHAMHFSEIAAIVRSPLLPGIRLDGGPAARMPEVFDLSRVAYGTDWTERPLDGSPSGNQSARPSRKTLREIAQRTREMPRITTAPRWSDHFREVLQLAGWTDGTLGSSDYQARDQFKDLLTEFGALAAVVGECSGRRALEMLRNIAHDRLFAPQSPSAPIQVLSRTDTVGLRFQSLWVLGLDDASWPSAPNPNPFIPARLQDEVGIARVSADAELSWAEWHAAAWATSAQNVTFSYAMSDGDAALRPSRALPASETALAADTLDDPHLAARAHPFMLRGTVELERYVDERGSVLPAGSVLRDGVGVLRDQALCPFRAWAIHRLGTREQRAPHSLPDAIDRGDLVHDALGAVCDAYSSQAALNEVEIGDVEEIVLNVVSRSGARWPATFRRHEVVRITRLLSAWLDVERRRRPFRIESIEDAHSMSIEGLNLNVRVDRVDVLQGGGRVVIDIKTGKASTANWQLPRPREPQLPLYSLLFDEVAAVAFAEINAQHVRMIGVGDGARLGLEIDRATRFDARDIEDLRSRWRAALTSIAREVRDGIAPAAPIAASVCRACHLHSLCRIFEQP